MPGKLSKHDDRRLIAELEARNERLVASHNRLLDKIKELKATISYRDRLIERLKDKQGFLA